MLLSVGTWAPSTVVVVAVAGVASVAWRSRSIPSAVVFVVVLRTVAIIVIVTSWGRAVTAAVVVSLAPMSVVEASTISAVAIRASLPVLLGFVLQFGYLKICQL